MKLKKAKIIVEPIETTNKRWAKMLRAKGRTRTKEEIISVSSYEILGRVFSPQKLEILALIPELKPKSIAGLAKSLKRDFKNVYTDVKFLADIGLIDLREEGARKTLVPVALFRGIELPLAA